MPIGHGKCNFCYSFLLAPKKRKASKKQWEWKEGGRREGDSKRSQRVFQELSACVFAICIVVAKAQIREEKKTDKKVLNTFHFMPFMSHTHKHTDAHTLTENMRGKFSRFENKAEKCRKKLAIGLTLPNKLTRFRCDAEYQSPPDDSDSARVLCPSWRGWKATRGEPRGTNGTEHSWFVW